MARLSSDVRFLLASEDDPGGGRREDQRRLLPTPIGRTSS